MLTLTKDPGTQPPKTILGHGPRVAVHIPARPAPANARSRVGRAWMATCTGIVLFTAVLVFILQNLHGLQISFLGLHGTLPASIWLLIAMAMGVAPAILFGIIRMRRPARI